MFGGNDVTWDTQSAKSSYASLGSYIHRVRVVCSCIVRHRPRSGYSDVDGVVSEPSSGV
jgi:hypothetical protein